MARWHNGLRRVSGLLNLVESLLTPDDDGDKPASRRNPYRMMEAILTETRDEARALGAGFAVSFVPSTAHTYPETVSSLEARRVDRLAEICRRQGIPFLDLVPVFRAQGRRPDGERVFHHYVHDKHWNAEGHRLAARELVKQLREQGQVPGDTPDPRL